jgi:hypothetical protein
MRLGAQLQVEVALERARGGAVRITERRKTIGGKWREVERRGVINVWKLRSIHFS